MGNATWEALQRAALANGVCHAAAAQRGAVQWLCNCKQGLSKLPSVQFVFGHANSTGTQSVTLTPGEYMVAQGGEQCLFGFMSAQVVDTKQDPMWLLGDRFLANRYVIYDYEHGRVGFSKSVRVPPSWMRQHWRRVLVAVASATLGLAVIYGLYDWRKRRRRTRARTLSRVSVAIHWSDPLADPLWLR